MTRMYSRTPYTGRPKNIDSKRIECCWNHGAQAKSPVTGTPCVCKNVSWSFLIKTEQDQALSSHVHGKNWPHSTHFWFGFFLY